MSSPSAHDAHGVVLVVACDVLLSRSMVSRWWYAFATTETPYYDSVAHHMHTTPCNVMLDVLVVCGAVGCGMHDLRAS